MLTTEQVESAIKPIDWSQYTDRFIVGHCPFATFEIFETIENIENIENGLSEKHFRVTASYKCGLRTEYFDSIEKAKEFAEKVKNYIIMRCFNVEQ